MLSLAGSAGLATAGPAQPAAVDEAAVLARIHALQAQPDAAQADWLRGWLDYRSRARRPPCCGCARGGARGGARAGTQARAQARARAGREACAEARREGGVRGGTQARRHAGARAHARASAGTCR